MGRDSKIFNGFVTVAIVVAAMACAPFTHAQTNAASDQGTERRQSGVDIHRDGWDRIVPQPPKQTGAPAPVRDLTGIWEPIPAYRDGVFALGPKANPADANHLLAVYAFGVADVHGSGGRKGNAFISDRQWPHHTGCLDGEKRAGDSYRNARGSL